MYGAAASLEAVGRSLGGSAVRGVAAEDVVLVRLDDVVPFMGRRADSLIWADGLSQAAALSRPVARYLTFMVAAGLIAGFGVIEVNSILIVGAMAVSPDLLPVTASRSGAGSPAAGRADGAAQRDRAAVRQRR